jgi:hypothetical protein
LEGGYRRIVGCDAMEDLVLAGVGGRKREHDDAAIGTACGKHSSGKLELADEGGVTLEGGFAFTSLSIPHSNGGIQTSRGYSETIECNRVDLM